MRINNLRQWKASSTLLVLVLVCSIVPAAAQTAGQNDAELHVKVALIALKDGNLEIARRELETAAGLAPQNGVIQYNLAKVNQQRGRADLALENLQRAMSLGLLPEDKKAADELLPILLYEKQKAAGSIDNLQGVWRKTRTESGTYSNNGGRYSVDEDAVLTVTGTGTQMHGRLALTQVFSDGSKWTRDSVADIEISEGRDGYQAVLTSARRKDHSDPFQQLPAAAVTEFRLRTSLSGPIVVLDITWRAGNNSRFTLTKQTPERIAVERKERAEAREEARQAALERFRPFSGTWVTSDFKTGREGLCTGSISVSRTIEFEDPSDDEVTGSVVKTVAWRARSGRDCPDSGRRDTTRTIQIRYDQSKRAFVGSMDLVSCRGDICSDESSDSSFVVEATGSSITLIFDDGEGLRFRRQ